MDALKLELLREATRGTCVVCCRDLGIQAFPLGGKPVTSAMGPAGFAVCVDCKGKPVRLRDGTLIEE